MEFEGKRILLVGLAKTGVSVVKNLNRLKAKLVVNDLKTKDELIEELDDLKSLSNIQYILGNHPSSIDNIDLVVMSPGVPLDLPFIEKLKDENIEIISEVELAYRMSSNQVFVGITGTNGKTTTTSIVGEIFEKSGEDTVVSGNIGYPVIDAVTKSNDSGFIVAELSSFQLESIDKFKPHISAVLNVTEDHLNRHKTIERYEKAKARIFENQTNCDFCILNYDNAITRKMSEKCSAKIVFFSTKEKIPTGVYLDKNNNIIIDIDRKIILLNKNELSLPGNHNLENCMAAVAISYVCGIDIKVIKQVLKTFEAVEHRQEFVRELNGVKYINDSKGTNPDSSSKALESYESSIILIAGGYDKGSCFDDLMEVAKNSNVRSVILIGETANKIEKAAKNKGINDTYIVKDMEEAVKVSSQISKDGDIVLLSPACASWDMYTSYEVRGEDFKENVHNLK